jgi:hypothetical protein
MPIYFGDNAELEKIVHCVMHQQPDAYDESDAKPTAVGHIRPCCMGVSCVDVTVLPDEAS